ncbi:NAD(+) diphosphatase [Levilactobacillus acidifarinae]|uniref:NAD(+) diphosphatase n=1 Tax=Levilactobacillus acidifarinae TaxID=267364 RepID=UPI00070912B1|nr:NAD(+) diphosphatase [Levilactobacillus acidifarinae]
MFQDIAPHALDNQFHGPRVPRPDDYVVIYHDQHVVLDHAQSLPRWAAVGQTFALTPAQTTYLLTIDETAIFLVTAKVTATDRYRYAPVAALRRLTPQWLGFAGATAAQLGWWYTTHRFCSNCGHAYEQDTVERALVCPQCGQKIYPAIAPAIIVAVTHGDQLLLTKFLTGYDKYTLISGYTEIGETLEDTVRREVHEEVGLTVHNVRYYGSQPWAASHALLVGFVADLDQSKPIALELDELSQAKWFHRDELPHDDTTLSLSWTMIEAFRRYEL